jgi:hypothetical protein
MERSCTDCIRGPEPQHIHVCINCGDELASYVPMSKEAMQMFADWKDGEERIDIIGSNGGDGAHYSDADLRNAQMRMALDACNFATAIPGFIGKQMGDAAGMPQPDHTASGFLRRAEQIMTERGKQYDKPEGERSMPATVTAFNAITGRDLRADEGWLLLTLLKHVRLFGKTEFHQDSAIDGIAYAALMAEEKAKM